MSTESNNEQSEGTKYKAPVRTFTPPFLIQMTCGDFNQQCDVFPHGSFHEVKKCQEGGIWLTKGVQSMPADYPYQIVSEKPEIKECECCHREYPKDWPFIKKNAYKPKGSTEPDETCVRCFEKKNIINREEYRMAVRAELKREMGI